MSANLMSLAHSGGKFLKLFGDRKMMMMPTASDYVQDGLIAMFDGIENAGWGVHDPNATGWLDLIGNRVAVFSGGIVHNTYWEPNNSNASFIDALFGAEFTAEFIFDGILSNAQHYATPLTNVDDTYSFFRRNGQYWEFKCYGTSLRSSLNPFLMRPFWVSKSTTAMLGGYYDGTGTFHDSVGANTTSFSYSTWQIGGNSTRYLGAGARIFAIRLYSRALTASEIAHNYAIDKARFNLPDKTI